VICASERMKVKGGGGYDDDDEEKESDHELDR
jgi:hypothetical protein